jgi:hypothetical protein
MLASTSNAIEKSSPMITHSFNFDDISGLIRESFELITNDPSTINPSSYVPICSAKVTVIVGDVVMSVKFSAPCSEIFSKCDKIAGEMIQSILEE